MKLRPRLTLLLLSLVAACQSPSTIERPGAEHEAELARLREIQADFRGKFVGTHTFDYEGHGRVTVREITLDGFPGNEYVRCRFEYQNRTDKPVVQTWVSLDVLDAKGRIVATQSAHLLVPIPIPIARGRHVSDELRTPTYGAHLQEGWSWRIRCVSELEEPEEPLDPPAPDPQHREVPPMTIKDRSGAPPR